MKLFISYSRDDKAWVYELARKLHTKAHHDAWIDQRLIAASNWWFSICENIEKCDCFIYILTPKSVESIYCEAELDYALALNKPVLPVRIKDCDIPAKISSYQVLSLADHMSLEEVLLPIEQGLGQIRVDHAAGNYSQPVTRPPRPNAPSPKADKPEHIFEVFVLAAEAAADHQLARAETLFKQVIAADPEGLGMAAAERLAEIKYEHDRAQAYKNVMRLAENPMMVRDAKVIWQQYARKYGRDHDPEQLAAKLEDALPAAVPVTAAPPVAVPVESPLGLEIEPTEDEIEPGEHSYARLTLYLSGLSSKVNRVKMTFEEIEQVLKRDLPPSAYKHRTWWSNRVENQVHERGWLDAGWRVVDIHIGERTVNFVRTGEREQQYIAFFSALLADMEEQQTRVPMRKLSPSGVHWQPIGSFRDKNNATIALLSFGFNRKRNLGIEFYIDTGDETRNKAIFDALNPDSFEQTFMAMLAKSSGEIVIDDLLIMNEKYHVHFQRLNSNRASRIAVYLQGAVTDSDKTLTALRRAALIVMLVFYDTLLAELPKTGEKYTYQA